MRKLILSLVLGISLGSFALPVFGQAESVKLKVAINENRPLAFFDEDDTPVGFYVDLLNYIAEEEGWELEYVEFPRAETLDLVDEGEIDLIATIGYDELFIDRYVFTEEKLLNNWGIVYVQADSTIESLLELEGKSIAILETSTHGKHFENLLDDFEIESTIIEVGSFADVVDLLERGEVDAGVLNRMIGVSFEEIYEIKGTSIIFNPIDVRIAASPITPLFVIERIDVHLQELKKDTNSYYYQSFSRWFGPAEQFVFPKWVTWVLGVGGGAILLLAGISFFLRYQVREKTAALVVQNKALFAEIEEHTKTYANLKESEERYRGVVEDSPVLICSFTPDGVITFANKTCCNYFDKQPDELIGTRFLDLIPVSEQEIVLANILSLTVEAPFQAHEHQATKPNGDIRWQHWTTRALFDDKGKSIAFQSIGQDITERKRVEDALRQSAQEMAALNAVSAQVNRSLSIKEVASAAVEGVLSATKASVAFLLAKEGAALVPVEIAYSKPEKEVDISLIGAASSCISEMALREVKPVYSKELYHDVRCTAGECKRAGFQSSAALPLFMDGEIYGVLGVGADTVIDFEAQFKFLEVLASEISNGIKNAHLFAEIQRELSERKKIEVALIESEEQFRTLFENSPVGIGVADQQGNIILFNDAMLQPGGYTGDDFQKIGNVMELYRNEVQRDSAMQVLQQEGFIEDFPVQFKRKNGSYYDATLSLRPITFKGESCVQAIVQDITERKQAEEALYKSNAFLNNIIEQSPHAMWIADEAGTLIRLNQACRDLLNVTDGDVVNKYNVLQDNIVEEQGVLPLVKGVFDEGEAANFIIEYDSAELDTIKLEKTVRVILDVNIFPIKDALGNVTNAVVQHTNITERLRAARELEESQRRLSTLMGNLPGMAYRCQNDRDWTMEFLSEGCIPLTGYKPEELVMNKRISYGQVIHPDDREMVWSKIQNALKKQGNFQVNYRILTASGDEKWVWEQGQGIYDSNNAVLALEGFVTDTTEQVMAERALTKYAGQLQMLNTITAALSTSLELDSVLELILEQIKQVFPIDSGAIFLIEGEHLRVVFDTGIDPSLRGQVFDMENQLFNEIKRVGEPLIVNNVREDHRYANWGDFQKIKSWMGVPLIVRGELIGFMTLDNNMSNAFQPEDIPLVSSFGSQSAQAIDNARQFRSAKQRLERLDALHRIDKAISNSLNLKVTLSVLLDQSMRQLRVDAAVVLMYSNNLQTLDFVQGRGLRTQALQHTSLRLGQGLAGKAALEREDVFVPDLSQSGSAVFQESPQFREEGFVAYYGVPLISKGSLVGVLEIFHRSPLKTGAEWVNFLHVLAEQAAIAIDHIALFDDLQKTAMRLQQAYDATIEGWASALELRDMETEGHSRRVVDTTIALAKMLGISGSNLTHVRRGALLHDIGKMGVPDSILQKPAPLTDDEWAIMKQHPALSQKWLASIDYLRPALDIPYCHHEKWDGSGYPRGLKGEQIPLAARIFAIVDVWDALRSDRPYRKAWTDEDALEYLKEQSGTHFDPRVVTVFLQYIAKSSR
jgi:PAS domain S-box-containing protein